MLPIRSFLKDSTLQQEQSGPRRFNPTTVQRISWELLFNQGLTLKSPLPLLSEGETQQNMSKTVVCRLPVILADHVRTISLIFPPV